MTVWRPGSRGATAARLAWRWAWWRRGWPAPPVRQFPLHVVYPVRALRVLLLLLRERKARGLSPLGHDGAAARCARRARSQGGAERRVCTAARRWQRRCGGGQGGCFWRALSRANSIALCWRFASSCGLRRARSCRRPRSALRGLGAPSFFTPKELCRNERGSPIVVWPGRSSSAMSRSGLRGLVLRGGVPYGWRNDARLERTGELGRPRASSPPLRDSAAESAFWRAVCRARCPCTPSACACACRSSACCFTAAQRALACRGKF